MKNFSLGTLALISVQHLIERAKNSEAGWDFEESSKILVPIWTNFDINPDLESYEKREKAQLLRICGNFLLTVGYSKSIESYIDRGKDLLTNAIDLFEDLEDINNAVESEVLLAYCYSLESKGSEYLIRLENAESRLAGKKSIAYLTIQVNRLIYYRKVNDFDNSFALINNIEHLIEDCTSDKIKYQFYNVSGQIYRQKNKFPEAIKSFKLAAIAASYLNNLRAEAMILNNLARVYQKNEFNLAIETAEKSLQIYRDLGDVGWVPHVLDTIAEIYFENKDYAPALRSINDALLYFYNSTDYDARVESLWFKVKILFTTNQDDQAQKCFLELQKTARQYLNEFTYRRFEKKLIKEFPDKVGNKDKIKSDDISDIKLLAVIPHERIVTHNLSIQNFDNICFYKFSKQSAYDYLVKSKREMIALVETEAKARRHDLLIFMTSAGIIEVGELIKNKISGVWEIENPKSLEFYGAYDVDHIGRIVGVCAADDLSKRKIIFTPAEKLTE